MRRVVTVVFLTLCLLVGSETRGEHIISPCGDICAKAERSLNLKEGLRFRARIVSQVDVSTDLQPGETFDWTREQAMAFDCRVMDRQPNGRVHIQFEYSWVRDMYFKHGGFYLYDSADPNSEEHYSHEEALAELLGRGFVAEIAPDGTVCCIEGSDELYEGLLDALAYRYAPSEADSKIRFVEPTKEQIERTKEAQENETKEFYRDEWPLSEQHLKDLVQQFFVVRPSRITGPNESWHTEELALSSAVRRSSMWTVKGTNDDALVLELHSHVCTDPNLCGPLVTVYYKAGTLMGSRTGEFTVDPDSGLLLNGVCIEELAGDLKLRDPYIHKTKIFSFPTGRTECVSIEIAIQQ